MDRLLQDNRLFVIMGIFVELYLIWDICKKFIKYTIYTRFPIEKTEYNKLIRQFR